MTLEEIGWTKTTNLWTEVEICRATDKVYYFIGKRGDKSFSTFCNAKSPAQIVGTYEKAKAWSEKHWAKYQTELTV